MRRVSLVPEGRQEFKSVRSKKALGFPSTPPCSLASQLSGGRPSEEMSYSSTSQRYIVKILGSQFGLSATKVEEFLGDERTYSAIADFLKGEERVSKLFEAALSVPIRLSLDPDPDNSRLLSLKFSEQAFYSVFRHAHVRLRACSDFPNLSLCVSGLGSFELVATGSNWKNSIS